MAAIDFPSNPTAYPIESPWTDPSGNRWYYTAAKIKWSLLAVTPVIDAAVIDGSSNSVSGNAVFDAMSSKAPLDAPYFTGGASISQFGVGDGASIFSDTGTGAHISSALGNFHAIFGDFGINQSFVARLKGAFGWFRGVFTGRIHPPDTLTADRTWTLPDASGFVALRDVAQAFTGTQTFTNAVTVSGLFTTGSVKANTTAGLDIKNSTGENLLRIGKFSPTTGFATGVAEGGGSASGNYSHAEGTGSLASGQAAHAEGDTTTASGQAAHSEGTGTTASGQAAHAEGLFSTASGDYSHAAGVQAKAIHQGSRVMTDGEFADCESTNNDQFTSRFAGGYRFLGGSANFFSEVAFNSGVYVGGQVNFGSTLYVGGEATITGNLTADYIYGAQIYSSGNIIAPNGRVFAQNLKNGVGTPEGAIYGKVGDIYTRQDGGAGTTLYVKEAGDDTQTGWVAK